jgi:transcriptional regulator with XRE-family HTH domain
MNQELAALGNAIRQIRKARKISQLDLGEECGLHRTYICDVERGARNITFLSLRKLAKALGLTVSEIIHQSELAMTPAAESTTSTEVVQISPTTVPAALMSRPGPRPAYSLGADVIPAARPSQLRPKKTKIKFIRCRLTMTVHVDSQNSRRSIWPITRG